MRVLKYWNKYVILGGICIFLILCGVLLALLRVLPDQNQPTQVIGAITILPANTYTPTATASDFQITPTETSLNFGGIQVGFYVQITGTGNSGLRVRLEPGLNSPVVFYGLDNEVFLVKDGPVTVDDYVWWFVAAPYDENRSGWAASDFLNLMEN